ncbi:hypothetical protein ABT095_01285 [Kitasatospora sp. NPDC002227]|uniref:hypothetical protein n=1 Tax=Kitasatospora sp. NPDC002227 TaxID=3154773 RepID=UPI00332DEE1C
MGALPRPEKREGVVRTLVRASVAAVVVVMAVACTPSGGGSKSADRASSSTVVPSAPAGDIPVGPGPKATYQVQPQPAPGSCHYRHTPAGEPLPDVACTPGALSPAVSQANLAQTICKTGGYTSGIRPPASITGKEKAENAKSYGYTGPMGDAEYDHLISLQLGGDPNDARNLWAQPPSPGHVPGKGPNNPKDSVETHLHTAICKGQVTLAAAQHAIATDWTTAESVLGLKPAPAGSAAADADGD